MGAAGCKFLFGLMFFDNSNGATGGTEQHYLRTIVMGQLCIKTPFVAVPFAPTVIVSF